MRTIAISAVGVELYEITEYNLYVVAVHGHIRLETYSKDEAIWTFGDLIDRELGF